MAPTPQPPEPPLRNRRPKLFWISLLVVWLFLGGILLFGKKGLFQLYQLSQERDRLLHINQRVKAENDHLCEMIDGLRHDQEMIEHMIRKELNYIKKNEVIYQLESNTGAGAKAPGNKSPRPPRGLTSRRSQ